MKRIPAGRFFHPSAIILHPYCVMAVSKQVTIQNKLGFHARPVMQFVDLANQFQSEIHVSKGGEEPADADGKSVMQMLTLAATMGTELRLDADGPDAETAVAKLSELIDGKFGEE
ncbi:MAG TPA: HPr family phosphocarrier protein [Tepidisphaeraceae bacterium]|jgi:phosphotransferase system HPr (HPr) family protein